MNIELLLKNTEFFKYSNSLMKFYITVSNLYFFISFEQLLTMKFIIEISFFQKYQCYFYLVNLNIIEKSSTAVDYTNKLFKQLQ